MAALLSNLLSELSQADSGSLSGPVKALQALEITGIFTGRELTRKDRRLSSGLAPIDHLLGAGIVRGRISEIVGPLGAGKTSLAASFVASATRDGEVAAWIDSAGSFDPVTRRGGGRRPTRGAGWLVPAPHSVGHSLGYSLNWAKRAMERRAGRGMPCAPLNSSWMRAASA